MADYMLERSEEKSIKSKTHRVTAVHHKRKHFGGKKETGSTGVENRFYKPEEFGRLTADQKQELFKMRGTTRSNKVPKSSSAKISALETKLEENCRSLLLCNQQRHCLLPCFLQHLLPSSHYSHHQPVLPSAVNKTEADYLLEESIRTKSIMISHVQDIM